EAIAKVLPRLSGRQRLRGMWRGSKERPDRQLAAGRLEKHPVKTTSFREGLRELVLQKFVAGIYRYCLRPRFTPDARSGMGERGQVERQRLATSCTGRDNRASRSATVEVFKDSLRSEDLEAGQL